MILRLIVALFLVQTASVAAASPSVANNTISWPDNGWYQVQQLTDNGIVNVCEGGRSCVVTPGEFNVINLSNGERFEGIQVTGDSSTQPDSVTVIGNTISWLDNGWYQVQSATTYASMCEGGLACTVPAGNYTVINHTTSKRWNNVRVGAPVASETQVSFDITVPVYASNALQVKLQWGNINTTASWISDESWTVTERLPINTEHVVTVTFSDDNGALTLGSVETTFATGSNPTETFNINASQFDTQRWDADHDGRSNLSELLAGTNPLQLNAPAPAQASLELMADKTLRIRWQAAGNLNTYRVYENSDGVSGYTDISGSQRAWTTYFDHRIPLFSRLNAQYLVQSCNALGCAHSVPVSVTNSLEKAVGFFKASDTAANAQFGVAVSFNSDGSRMVVGAPGVRGGGFGLGDTLASGEGAVYVYRRIIGGWEQTAYLRGSNTGDSDRFGQSVSLSTNGTTLVVGAPSEGSAAMGVNGNQADNSAERSGAVYVFVLSGGTWWQQSYLKASNTQDYARFGWDVGVSSDGNTLAVGAPYESSAATGINGEQNNNNAYASGAVYLFERSAGGWQQQAYIKASGAERGDQFGYAVDLGVDGNKLAVGAIGEDSAADGMFGNQSDNSAENAGATYVFVRNGTFWEQDVYIKGTNSESFDRFGTDVSLSDDGGILVVGAPAEDSAATGINGNLADNSARDSGAIYVFASSGSFWQRQAYIKSSNTEANDAFGSSVSVSADGNVIAVGAVGEDSAASGINTFQNDNALGASGAAYVFSRNSGVWQQQAYVNATNTGSMDNFGNAVTLSADGETLAVGARGESSSTTGFNADQGDNAAENAGAVYIY